MQQQCVDNWDTPLLVSEGNYILLHCRQIVTALIENFTWSKSTLLKTRQPSPQCSYKCSKQRSIVWQLLQQRTLLCGFYGSCMMQKLRNNSKLNPSERCVQMFGETQQNTLHSKIQHDTVTPEIVYCKSSKIPSVACYFEAIVGRGHLLEYSICLNYTPPAKSQSRCTGFPQLTTAASLKIESIVCGHHVYKAM